MKTTTYHIDPDRDPAEWAFAWGEHLRRWGANDEPNGACGGKIWQYMGTQQDCGFWRHLFRHRMHPTTGRREYWQAPASEAFTQHQKLAG